MDGWIRKENGGPLKGDAREGGAIRDSIDIVTKEGERCTGRCKEMARRIAEHVKAETEQWSEMKGMLHRVKAEIDGLYDFWVRRSIES
ncbi:hypothetical protein QJS10_CPA07g00835 [Acorus calamus]|uniref:Uncharacterized protein n=1 Tax=Acorus calamus TaxID=4465 RepID=A0AAV9EEP5_ACOCL|nr:hypothetical protein QJS10_CPA07g00835 [Acorus calamus]